MADRGVVCQKITLLSLTIHQNGIQLQLNPTGQDKIVDCTLNTKLLIDCMGNQSPIVQEIRRGQKPDGKSEFNYFFKFQFLKIIIF